jgi:GT2 family glycosyltransferase
LKLSVIIVNYNVQYFLEQCLASVKKAAAHIECDIWVVDNHSVDKSVEMVKEKFPEVKLIANSINVGFAKANNQAIIQSKAEYILLLNPDTIVEEDTFVKVCNFMDSHPDAGGLGVRMIDGKGNFLPESKRGLPSPSAAFYKMFGLSKLFPKSKIFGVYHMGFLPEFETNCVDVLSGAFMLLRSNILVKTGLLDEDYFMYAEDVDLSYQITKAGYKNYYYPETTIIHYKGESTKKGSVNYVYMFYKAMAQFVEKNFSQSNAKTFNLLINFAIWLRAFIAIIYRFISTIILPVCDAALIFICIYAFKYFFEFYIKNGELHLQKSILYVNIPIYIFCWIFAGYLNRAYDRQVSLINIIRSVVMGTMFISIFYAFINENYRNSRAIILAGALSALLVFMFNRIIWHYIRYKTWSLNHSELKNSIIIGNKEEALRVQDLLNKTAVPCKIAGIVSNEKIQSDNNSYLGETSEIVELVDILNIDEIIFCSKDIDAGDIMNIMSKLQNKQIEFKMVPENSLYIIGSSSKDHAGDFYSVNVNMDIKSQQNRFIKRSFDISMSIIIFIVAPYLILISKNKSHLYSNIFNVLKGKKSWVGYAPCEQKNELPSIKDGVLNPTSGINLENNGHTSFKLNLLYAKDYSIEKDIQIILRGFKDLGK